MNDLALAGASSPARIDRLTAALAPATRAAYANGWRKWEAFADARGTTTFPAEPADVAAFVDYLDLAGAKPSTINTALAAVSAAHRLAAAPANPTGSADVRAAVKRAVRDYRDAGGTVRQSRGITAADVARIEATAYLPRRRGNGKERPGTAKARADLDMAIIRTMRDCLARVSEAAAFTWQQIEHRPDGSATITFRRPKTDADTTAYLSPATVAALDRIQVRRQSWIPRLAKDTETLFGLSASQIKARITAAAKAAGLEGVSSHGCRIGMAQDLARTKGIEMPAIMQAGGWRSETTVARYTARETASRGAVARFYAQEGGAEQ